MNNRKIPYSVVISEKPIILIETEAEARLFKKHTSFNLQKDWWQKYKEKTFYTFGMGGCVGNTDDVINYTTKVVNAHNIEWDY